MYSKNELTTRERKQIKSKKVNDITGIYSSKHINDKEELQKWNKKNSTKKGGKSRHYKETK